MLHKILSFCLIVLTIAGLALPGAATATTHSNDIYNTDLLSTEKKVISTTTLDDNFADDCIIVVMKNSVSLCN